MKQVYIGILAGGSGERLWPLSTKHEPKQLIPFLYDQSLLEQTYERISTLTEQSPIFIVTHQGQEALIKAAMGEKINFIITEPCARNTAPAMLLSCYEIFKRDPEALVVFVPADHFIPQKDIFQKVMRQVLAVLEDSKNIGILGIKPRSAATGYGYIQVADEQDSSTESYALVSKFHEKPNQATAELYCKQPDMLWNAGIFAAQVSVFLQEFKQHVPQLVDAMEKYVRGEIAYDQLPALSFDYAILEKTKHLIAFRADFEWYDVGSVPMFLELQKTYAVKTALVISIDGKDNLVSSSKKVIACVGVSDLCIVETDDVLLIVNKEKGELVKRLLDKVPESTR